MSETTNYQKHLNTNPFQRFLINNFYKGLVRIVGPLKPKKILDVGCGEGFTLFRLETNKIGEILEGVDNSDDALAFARKLHPSFNTKKGDIYELPYQDNSFDLLICTEVLEHLINPDKALLELKRVTNKYLILSVPNEPFFILANLLRGKYVKTLGNDPEHIGHWTAPLFKKFLRMKGLTIIDTKYPFPWTLVLARKQPC